MKRAVWALPWLAAVVGVALVAYAIAGSAPKCEEEDLYLPEYDENGLRCEGDCDPDIPCQYCNPKGKEPRNRQPPAPPDEGGDGGLGGTGEGGDETVSAAGSSEVPPVGGETASPRPPDAGGRGLGGTGWGGNLPPLGGGAAERGGVSSGNDRSMSTASSPPVRSGDGCGGKAKPRAERSGAERRGRRRAVSARGERESAPQRRSRAVARTSDASGANERAEQDEGQAELGRGLPSAREGAERAGGNRRSLAGRSRVGKRSAPAGGVKRESSASSPPEE